MKPKENQVIKEIKKLSKKIDIVEESVNLGTLDATVLALMIFIVALGFTLLSLNFTKSIQNIPQLFVFGVYFVVLSIPVIMAIYTYTSSIFQKEARFWRKKWVFLMLEGLGLFIGFLFLMLWGFSFYEKWHGPGSVSKNFIYVTFVLVIIGIILFLCLYERKKIDKYFRENFKNILERREAEIKRNKKRK